MKHEVSFWVTNVTNRNVSLSDLNLTIKAFTSVNLMDTKHYQYTLEQLIKSVKEGSLFRKRKMIYVRKIAPDTTRQDVLVVHGAVIPPRDRSIFTIKEEHYEELDISDDESTESSIDPTIKSIPIKG